MNRKNFKVMKLAVTSILLDQNNPRIRVANTQEECFRIMMDHPAEQTALISLAKHIAKNGISIEPIVVSKSDESRKYIVRDGNRRIMALKLLLNPQKCPDPATQKIFVSLKNKYSENIDKRVDVYFSSDENSIIEYIELKHTGENGGVGQRQWSAFLQSYFGMKNEKNAKYKRAAQLLLWMEARKYPLNSDFPITTLARFLSIDYLSKFGFEVTDERIFVRENYDWNKTYHIFKVILDNISNKKINVSRSRNSDSDSVINIADAEEILEKYVNEGIKNYEKIFLTNPVDGGATNGGNTGGGATNGGNTGGGATNGGNTGGGATNGGNTGGGATNGGNTGGGATNGGNTGGGATNGGNTGGGATNGGNTGGGAIGGKPTKPKKLKNIIYSSKLNDILLSSSKYTKLQILYSSLCTVSVEQHPSLTTVGIWAFIESLANLHGKITGDFNSFFGNFINTKLNKGTKSQKNTDFKKSLEYFNNEGNMTKHSSIAMTLDSETIINKFAILDDFFIAVLEDIHNKVSN